MARPLRVALVTHGKLPVFKYGGTQRDVVWLALELIRLGHQVTILAEPGSHVPGARMVAATSGEEMRARMPTDLDLVHFHCSPPPGITLPYFRTAHGNPVEGRPLSNINLCFISRNHAARYGRKTFVYNGIPPEDMTFRAEKSPRYLYFSSVERATKNLNRAVDLARKFDFQLDIAGGSRWDLLLRSQVRREGTFFKTFGGRFRFHGLVGGEPKKELFANARGLVFPIRWEEPFGLVVVEALLSGTPVIACPRGSMPEMIHPDVGFLCDSDEDFGAAFARIGDISPHRCREYAADNFSAAKMAREYVKLYERVLNGETLP